MKLTIAKTEYKIVVAHHFWKRIRGLMGQKNISYGMLFPKCNQIHTYFMKENIDLLGLNENNEVIYKYENLPPKKVIKVMYPVAKTNILELPKGASQKVKLGSILIFENE